MPVPLPRWLFGSELVSLLSCTIVLTLPLRSEAIPGGSNLCFDLLESKRACACVFEREGEKEKCKKTTGNDRFDYQIVNDCPMRLPMTEHLKGKPKLIELTWLTRQPLLECFSACQWSCFGDNLAVTVSSSLTGNTTIT